MARAELTIKIADVEPVRQVLRASGELARGVEWVLNDLAYCAPEDRERQARAMESLKSLLRNYKATVIAQGDQS